MKNTRQKICTTIRDLKLYLVDLLSVRAQKIKSTQDQSYTIYILAWSELLIFYLLLVLKNNAIYQKYKKKNTLIYFYNH